MNVDLDDLPEPGDVVGGRYRIEQVLGSGASGVVYEASHELTGKSVAIKWLRPDLASSDAVTARFLREARAACAIDHPNVVSVFDAGRERGTLFLVMERLRGEPLTAFLLRGPHGADALIATLMPALRGVAAAHEHNIVHRDLKPDNVFLAEPRPGWPGGAKVLDFGISKLKQPADGRELTHSGVFLGSPLYMAPEQILEPSGVDGRADVYSLGVMLYEGLTGRVPFEADSLHELFRKVMTEAPAPIRLDRPDVPPELESIVLRAIARERRARIGSIVELARALEGFSAGTQFDLGDDVVVEVLGEATRATPMPLDGARTQIVRGEPDTGRDTDPPPSVSPIGGDAGATQVEIRMPSSAAESEGRHGRPSSAPSTAHRASAVAEGLAAARGIAPQPSFALPASVAVRAGLALVIGAAAFVLVVFGFLIGLAL